jgi:undecaprenyl-diphosphatase
LAAYLPIIILAIIQGITEFLPVSSSGHLVLVWHGFDEFGMVAPAKDGAARQMLDVAVHVGSLGAVIIYFWRDVLRIAAGAGALLVGKMTPGGKLFLLLVLATIPLVIAGFAMKQYFGTGWRSIEVVGWASIGFGILLYVVDRTRMTLKRMEHFTYGAAFMIGCSQILALIPGTSRSGITMTAARYLGYERSDAARFSMLLSIPAIIGAGTLLGYDLYKVENVQLQQDAILAAVLALISALGAIAVMMAWLRRASFTPFVIYRVLLGVAILYFVYFEGLGGTI